MFMWAGSPRQTKGGRDLKTTITKPDLARARKALGKDKFVVTDGRKFINEEKRIQRNNARHGKWRKAFNDFMSQPLPDTR
jgi:hypothetical protein